VSPAAIACRRNVIGFASMSIIDRAIENPIAAAAIVVLVWAIFYFTMRNTDSRTSALKWAAGLTIITIILLLIQLA
jgi:hypothetical protein